MPETSLGVAPEGLPAVLVQTKQFARLRTDNDRGQVLQFWVADPDLVQAYAADDPDTYRGAPGYSRKVVMARLDRLDPQILREVLVQPRPGHLRRRHADLR